jgi:glycerol kinase
VVILPLSVKPRFSEMTVRGAAIAAGLAAKVWPDTDLLPELEADVFTSNISGASE